MPVELATSADELAKPSKAIYMNYLLKPLRERMREKASRFPELFDVQGLDTVKNFHEFDARYTAPMHGFSSIYDYWEKASSLNYLPSIAIPTLLVSALDDPFLSPACFPREIAQQSKHFFLETPKHGGHVGFITGFSLQSTWVERRTLEFVSSHLGERNPTQLRVWA